MVRAWWGSPVFAEAIDFCDDFVTFSLLVVVELVGIKIAVEVKLSPQLFEYVRPEQPSDLNHHQLPKPKIESKTMKKLLLTTIGLAAVSLAGVNAQLMINDFNPVTINFTGFTAPATWATSTPAAGQLNSSIWAINSEVPRTTTAATFGSDVTGGLGTSTGGVTTGGVYAFDVGGGVTALGVQPTGSFWTPGMFTLRLQNNTGATLTSINVDWTVYVFNDQARSNDFRFYYSADNATYTHAGASVEVVSPGAADPSPAWVATNRSFSITSLNITNGSFYYLRWGGDDVSGSGNRDEFGLAGISITAIPEPSSLLLLGMGGLAFLVRRKFAARK